MDKENTKEIPSAISWQASEFEYQKKDVSWYWLSIIIAIILIALALWQKNFLFAIFVVIAEIVVISLVGRFPPIWEFKINVKGIEISRPNSKEKKIYDYKDIASFDIHMTENDEKKELVIKFQSRVKPFLRININSKDEKKIKEFLLKFLPQEEIHGSAADSVSKLIRF